MSDALCRAGLHGLCFEDDCPCPCHPRLEDDPYWEERR